LPHLVVSDGVEHLAGKNPNMHLGNDGCNIAIVLVGIVINTRFSRTRRVPHVLT
jgi:hypothetical protein